MNMFDVDMDVVNKHVVELKKKYSLTKYILGFSTVVMTWTILPFMRIILQANGNLSTLIATIYALIVTRLGFTVIFYPWHLVVSKSVTYSARLKVIMPTVCVVSFLLVIAKSLLAPSDLFRYETDSSVTTLRYKVVATVFWSVLLVGSFLVVPFYIRRLRLLQSRSWTLLTFVIPYVVIMMTATLFHEWGAGSQWMSYSISILIVLFGATSGVDYCTNMNVRFNEAYVMVAGFIPFWLGSVLGRVLLVIFEGLGPLGSIVVFGFWKLLIFLFEVLSTVVGKKASRYNDGSVFSFCVIYTGSYCVMYFVCF